MVQSASDEQLHSWADATAAMARKHAMARTRLFLLKIFMIIMTMAIVTTMTIVTMPDDK